MAGTGGAGGSDACGGLCGVDLACDVGGLCDKEAVQWVAMRDQIELHTFVFLPDGPGPWPTVLLRTPYLQDGFYTAWSAFPDNGYAYVAQSVRGTGQSQGMLEPLLQEFNDGRDTVLWLAAQPWSNGAVGTIGGSYPAFTAIAAALDSPEVEVVIADGGIGDAFTGWPLTDGMNHHSGLLWWLEIVAGNDLYADASYSSIVTNHRPLGDLDLLTTGALHPTWRSYLPEMDTDSTFWRERSLTGKLHRLCTPAVHIQAVVEWADDPLNVYLEAASNACPEA